MSETENAPKNGDRTSPHRIGAVADATGLTTHTIRVWERRYRAVEPLRTAGGTRLYSAEQVERLRLLKQLTDLGHGIGAIASLPKDRLLQLLPRKDASSAPEWFDEQRVRAEFFDALEHLDVGALEAILGRATLELAPREVVLRVAAPIAAELGERWQAGELSIGQEHAASARLRDLLGRMRVNTSAPAGAPKLVAATLSGDRHELGLLMATLLASLQGWSPVYLGVDLPLPELVDAVVLSRASALVLSLVHVEPLAAQALLRELRQQLSAEVRVYIGGRAAAGVQIAGVRRPEDLEAFERELRQLRGELATN